MEIDFNHLKHLLIAVEKEIGQKITYLIFNENEELEFIHLKYIYRFLSNLKYSSSIIIFEGIGGDSKAGRSLALELRKIFHKGYWVAVPNFSRSTLVYSIFPSSAILMDDTGFVSPVDPIIKCKSGRFKKFESCITLMKSSNKKEAQKATRCWMEHANFLLSILETLDGSIVHEYDGLKINQVDAINALFLRSPHTLKIKKSDLQRIKFKTWEVEGKNYWNLIKTFTNDLKCQLVKNREITFVVGDSETEYVNK